MTFFRSPTENTGWNQRREIFAVKENLLDNLIKKAGLGILILLFHLGCF